jgi:anti-sigma regulatory factor (Ser/Thr protein kinase)
VVFVATSSLTEAVFSLPEDDRRGGVALARDFARRTTVTSGYRGNHEDVVLVVNELTTNAVHHGGGHPFVRIAAGRYRLRVEVIDEGAGRPAMRSGSWGMQLVALLGESWGVTERRGQKVVWCELTA